MHASDLSPASHARTKTNSVLIVEDDDAIRNLIHAVLVSEGFEATAVANGSQAIAEVADRVPALILLDVHLGDGQDAQTLVTKIRAHVGDDVHLIVTSASNQQASATVLGACGYVSKPFELEALLQEIRRGLAGGNRSDPGAPRSPRPRSKPARTVGSSLVYAS